ncbi:hypothetical protein, partial [Pseudomonas aeruginosa]|uniref:hypothetical protein n=1 Tax=Pseudomonas aeruginosa TaxID=287 RepID=UPI002F90F34C
GKSGVFLVAFCARLKTYGAFFGDKNHKAFSRFCLCGHEKSGLIGAVRFFNLASPAALLTLVGRNKTPDKPLGALP